MLKHAPAIAPTRSDHVLGMLPFAARPKSLEDREAARLAEVRCTMIAVDTDTVLRHPTGDHPEQSARTRQTGADSTSGGGAAGPAGTGWQDFTSTAGMPIRQIAFRRAAVPCRRGSERSAIG